MQDKDLKIACDSRITMTDVIEWQVQKSFWHCVG